MPPYLAMPYFHLSKLPLTTKVGLSIFYSSLIAGFVFVAVWYYPMMAEHAYDAARNMQQKEIGPTEAYRDHFAPHEATRAVMEKNKASPADVEDAVKTQKQGQRKEAANIVHPHSFLMPVIFFILIHLMEMTALWQKAKIPLYAFSGLCMIVTVFAPLIVLSVPGLALVCFGAMYAMLLCFTAMAVAPMTQMWFAKA